jgi:hypothetical protein
MTALPLEPLTRPLNLWFGLIGFWAPALLAQIPARAAAITTSDAIRRISEPPALEDLCPSSPPIIDHPPVPLAANGFARGAPSWPTAPSSGCAGIESMIT